MNRSVETVVAGAGRFGHRAVYELLSHYPQWHIHVIDNDPLKLRGLAGNSRIEPHEGEAVPILDHLLQEILPNWIVPAVPFHLAYAWLVHVLARDHNVQGIPVPEDLPVPHPYKARTGDLYTSYAAFLCPEDCPEPEDTCTVTGEGRSMPLFHLLAGLSVERFRVLGLRSRQLGAGVGGYRGRDLLVLKEEVESFPGELLLFTACRCHGVLSGLQIGPPKH